jgi:hypothetical protein
MTQLINPITTIIDGKEYILSKFPAVAGRKIISNYTLSAIPKLGDYNKNEETMFELMSYVAVKINDIELRLSNKALIDNHVPDWEVCLKIEMAMMEYNCRFFLEGKASIFFKELEEALPAWTAKMLTALSQQLSQMGKPLSGN